VIRFTRRVIGAFVSMTGAAADAELLVTGSGGVIFLCGGRLVNGPSVFSNDSGGLDDFKTSL